MDATTPPHAVAMPIRTSPPRSDEAITARAFIELARINYDLKHRVRSCTWKEPALLPWPGAPKLRSTQTWPRWYGLRYAVGPATGAWLFYWPGCNPCPENTECYLVNGPRRDSLATAKYPGLDSAAQVGVAVVWRGGQPYFAVVWPGICPTPQPMPTFSSPGPTGPGW